MRRNLVVLLLFVLFAASARAQVSPRRRPVGEQSPGYGGPPAIGDYDRWEASRTRLAANRPAAPPVIPQPDTNHLIPVSQLSIPSKAVKEFERSQKAFQSGDLPGSAAHLQKALRIYPDFIDAHNILGLRYLQLGENQKALAEHETALAVDHHVAQTHEYLALSLLALNRPQESEAEAREALDLDPVAPGSRYILARALIGQHRITPEAIDMLRQVEDAVPNASLVLAQIYFNAGQNEQVVAALRRYLRAPTAADNKQKAECWVAQLSAEPLPAGCPTETTRPSFH